MKFIEVNIDTFTVCFNENEFVMIHRISQMGEIPLVEVYRQIIESGIRVQYKNKVLKE